MEEPQDIKFLEHLEMLRGVLIKIISIAALALFPCWFIAPEVLDLLQNNAKSNSRRHIFIKNLLPFSIFLPFAGTGEANQSVLCSECRKSLGETP